MNGGVGHAVRPANNFNTTVEHERVAEHVKIVLHLCLWGDGPILLEADQHDVRLDVAVMDK